MEKKLLVKLETVGDLQRAYDEFLLEGCVDGDVLCPRRNGQTPDAIVVWVTKEVGLAKEGFPPYDQ